LLLIDNDPVFSAWYFIVCCFGARVHMLYLVVVDDLLGFG